MGAATALPSVPPSLTPGPARLPCRPGIACVREPRRGGCWHMLLGRRALAARPPAWSASRTQGEGGGAAPDGGGSRGGRRGRRGGRSSSPRGTGPGSLPPDGTTSPSRHAAVGSLGPGGRCGPAGAGAVPFLPLRSPRAQGPSCDSSPFCSSHIPDCQQADLTEFIKSQIISIIVKLLYKEWNLRIK